MIDVKEQSLVSLMSYREDYFPVVVSIESLNPEVNEGETGPRIGR